MEKYLKYKKKYLERKSTKSKYNKAPIMVIPHIPLPPLFPMQPIIQPVVQPMVQPVVQIPPSGF